MDHAEPGVDRVPRAVKVDRIAIDEDLPAIGRIEPHQDVHQGRFAGPILSQQGMNLSLPNGEIDPVVGNDTGKALDDRRASRPPRAPAVGAPEPPESPLMHAAGLDRPVGANVH